MTATLERSPAGTLVKEWIDRDRQEAAVKRAALTEFTWRPHETSVYDWNRCFNDNDPDFYCRGCVDCCPEEEESGHIESNVATAHLAWDDYNIDRDVRDRFHVNSVRVDDEHQGRGHGRRLMEAVIAHADSRGRDLELRVLESNTIAIRLYQSLGFVIVPEHNPWLGLDPYHCMVRTHTPGDTLT